MKGTRTSGSPSGVRRAGILPEQLLRRRARAVDRLSHITGNTERRTASPVAVSWTQSSPSSATRRQAPILTTSDRQRAVKGQDQAGAFRQDFSLVFENILILTPWRRTPYSLGEMPRALRANKTSGDIDLGSFHDDGVGWKFLLLEREGSQARAALTSADLGVDFFLTNEGKLQKGHESAESWNLQEIVPFRGGDKDVCVRIKSDSGAVLCSNNDGEVALVSEMDADELDDSGIFIWNTCWECTTEDQEVSFPELDLP